VSQAQKKGSWEAVGVGALSHVTWPPSPTVLKSNPENGLFILILTCPDKERHSAEI
jgi:hypothetical protein